jgi:hypothetical protein
MRKIPSLDPATIAMFGLDGAQIRSARSILSSMGRDSAWSTRDLAFSAPENSAHAALWVALRADAPWPWLAAELEQGMNLKSEERNGCKLFCAIIARLGEPTRDPRLSPNEAIEALAGIGARCGTLMHCPAALSAMSPHKKLELAAQLEEGRASSAPRLERGELPALGAWGMPVLYTPSRFGDYGSMPNKERGLLAASCSDLISAALDSGQSSEPATETLLGFGPFASILAQAPMLCAPLTLRAKAQRLCSALRLAPEDLACSVSFHACDDREWLRIGLRPAETGFCLDGFDWPAEHGGLDAQFGRLLQALEDNGVEWCHQVEGRFDALLCPDCGEPIYPNPAHEPWTRFCLEAGAPPDGSHKHP